MDELLNWVAQQHSGLRTYRGFQQKVLQLAAEDSSHAAMFYLLGSIVSRFIDSYEEDPLPVAVADQAFKRLSELVKKSAQAMNAPAADQIKVLNEIARTDLG